MGLTEANFKLLRAAYSGAESDVKAALGSSQVDKNCHENTGNHCTAVQRAALSNESVVKFFIEDAGVRLNLKDDLGQTLLHLSWRTCVQRLKESKRMDDKDWDLCDKIDQTPFLTQARFVNRLIVSDLLEVQLRIGGPAVDMNKTTIDGFTALHQVVEQDPLSFPTWYNFRPPGDRCDLVESLLDELKKRARQSLLDVGPGQPIPTVAQVEGKVLGFVNAIDKLKRSALHYIAEDGCVQILNKLLNCFHEPIRSQIHLNQPDLHGFAPLHLAVRRGHSSIVQRILPLVDPNATATVTATHPLNLLDYQEHHKQLCRPNLFSRKPSETYSGQPLRPLHFAAMSGHTEITALLLGNNNTDVFTATKPTPLEYSIVNRHFQVAAMLLLDDLGRTVLPIARDARWKVFDTVLCLAEGPDDKIIANQLLTLLQRVIPPILPVQPIAVVDGIRIELLITVAARENWHEIIRHILKWTPEVDVNIKSQWPTYGTPDATPLHFAVFNGHRDAVRELLTHLPLDANSEDSDFRTPLEIASTTKIADSNTRREIEKLLMGRPEVKELVDRLYRDRQVLVDAANALLVGAALIASVTFAGWLQPPLGYTPYYEYPESLPAPPGTYESYAAVRQHTAVQAFWFFNSLSFFFAIATVLAGANAAMPSLENAFIGTVVKSVKLTLIFASILLAISVACVLGAFATAGFAVLPPATKYNWSMKSTVAIGGSVCLICLAFFLWKLSELIRNLQALIWQLLAPICLQLRLADLTWRLLAPICLPLCTFVLKLTG